MDILLIFLISCFSYSNWFLGKSMLDRPDNGNNCGSRIR